MTEEKLIPVNVTLADRNYRVRVDVTEEENLRKTVKLINDKILEFKTTLAGKDMQDYIAMVVLWYATQNTTQSNPALQEHAVQNELERIIKLLDKVA